ncbi:MAG: methyltransferase domain-containing protein [Actinomycetota bacterium]|nr:methyltransferase domain-containing protein [Actinomycetota bacterium]
MAGVDEGFAFACGLSLWRRSLGTVRDAVRQELVGRQLEEHLRAGPGKSLRVLDVGCGQGTQALKLARLGHAVLGVDLCEELLADARRAAADEPPDVRARLSFERADLLALGPGLVGSFDVVCCHGVLMYLASLDDALSALIATVRPGGIVSVLTRNRAGLAMRAGMSGDWQVALESFDACRYTNRLAIADVRADDPEEVRQALSRAGAQTLAWYGVRLFCDHWQALEPPPDLADLVAVEEQAGRRDPYRSVAAMTHTIGRTAASAPAR